MKDQVDAIRLRPLGEVVELISGQHIAAKDYNAEGSGVPYLTGPSDFGVRHPIVARWTEHPKKFARRGDILVTVKGSGVGSINVVDIDEVAISRQLMAVRAKEAEPRFIELFLSQQGEYFQQRASGAAIPGLSRHDILDLGIPLPPLEEQKRIVAVLDQAFAALERARAHAEANLADASKFYERRREKLLNTTGVGWKRTTVGEVCKRFEYGTSAKSQPTGRIPVLRMGNLQGGEIDWTNLVYTDDDGDIQKLLLRPRDVLFNRTNSVDHVGKTAIYRGEREAIFAGYLIRLNLKAQVDPEFINIFLNSDVARNYGRSVMGKSVNQANISASKLKDYPLWLPPLEEQKRFVQSLEALRCAVDELKSQYAGIIADIADLRQSLLQKAFSGQLT